MIRDELSQAVEVANTINNEGVRIEAKVNAAIRALEQLLDVAETLTPGEPSAYRVEPVFLGPGANDVVLQMYGIEPADTPQVLEDAAAVEAALIGGDVRQASGYANHRSNAPSTSLYDVMPERKKLERMNVEDLKTLAEHHGIAVPDGTKGTLIDAMVGPKASS